MALSVMEIHADSISDLLSSEPHRRLEVKKVLYIAICMNICQVKYPCYLLTGHSALYHPQPLLHCQLHRRVHCH